MEILQILNVFVESIVEMETYSQRQQSCIVGALCGVGVRVQ